MEHWWNDTDRGKPKYWEKNLSNRNPTYTSLESNPGLHSEVPANQYFTPLFEPWSLYVEILMVRVTCLPSVTSAFPCQYQSTYATYSQCFPLSVSVDLCYILTVPRL
jgi:hypothetical protein